MNIRIGLSGNCLLPSINGELKLDGIGVYTKNLAEMFQQKGMSVNLTNFVSLKAFGKNFLRLNIIGKEPAPYVSAFLPSNLSAHGKLEKKIDIFHSTDYSIPRLKKVPVIATLHDAIMLKHPEFVRASVIKNFKYGLLKRTVQWADHVISISQAMVEDIVNYWNVKEEKITVIHNGIEPVWLESISPERINNVKNKYNLTKEYLLFVGTLQPRKNISRIIEAYKLLPKELQQQYQLLIVGKNGWSTETILKDIAEMEAKQWGKWLEYIPFEDVRALYQGAKLLLFPSLSEGFGLPILEGFASRIPVLTSNVTSMPEIAGECAQLVDPYEVESMRDGIEKLLTNQDFAERLIHTGYERAKQFSWQRCAEETLTVYKKFI